MKTDTIAAIATALSNSGIGIIRISGNEAVSIGDAVFRTKSGKRKLADVKSHTIHYGYIVDYNCVNDNNECRECKRENDSEDWKKYIASKYNVNLKPFNFQKEPNFRSLKSSFISKIFFKFPNKNSLISYLASLTNKRKFSAT